MTGKSRRDEYAEQTRAAVVQAAVSLFTAHGYAATTIDAVAAEAHVAKGGVYHVFLAECCEPDFRQIVLLEAPAALGGARWKELDEQFFLGLMKGGLDDLTSSGRYEFSDGDLTARVLLAALTEAGRAAATAAKPEVEVRRAKALMERQLHGLRTARGV